MLFLLRKIRRKLISTNNKFITYLLYAIGEIILVVVGILIAVQIDNWNQGKLQQQKRIELIENLKLDIETDLQRLATALKRAEDINKRSKKFLSITTGNVSKTTTDSLLKYASNTFFLATFKPINSTYQTAQSTGDIGLINDKELLELYVDYEDSFEWLKLHVNLAGDLIYKGSHWELRKKLGSNNILTTERTENTAPLRFKLSAQELRELILSKEFYATFENMDWIQNNIYRGMKELNKLDSAINIRLNNLLTTKH